MVYEDKETRRQGDRETRRQGIAGQVAATLYTILAQSLSLAFVRPKKNPLILRRDERIQITVCRDFRVLAYLQPQPCLWPQPEEQEEQEEPQEETVPQPPQALELPQVLQAGTMTVLVSGTISV